ncbi:FAD-dependent oxidoreductase [Salinisphaera sp. P385]|uniref:FAD-dependent oxidoreductase n=1 Tax=Spectribacter acetivorans TaxID=3075603 RepID=A0ABU3B5N3_9GAMM|nr:FAD-dependent oxidoreductase [Salinisphaera sp. P385]MDT0617445.1 FAD-dependent oxidoreductase [Salinisphaera sp. P385]
MSETTVIVGAGHAAGMLTTTLIQKKYDGKIVIVGEEAHLPYQRPPLSKAYLSGEVELSSLYLKPQETYDKAGVTLSLDTRVEAIDRDSRELTLADGSGLTYDNLVLATGSQVRRIPVPGADLDGIHYLRTIADVDALRPALTAGQRLVIVGGGYIGLEVAAVAAKLGVSVTVLETEGRVMARVTGETISRYFERKHREAGVDLRTGTRVVAFEAGDDGQVSGVTCDDGSTVPADLVLVSIGIQPETTLAEAAGLPCDDGILVDEYTRTDDPHILAIGDCTRHRNLYFDQPVRLESVANAVDQARTAAATLTGGDQPYNAAPWFWSNQYDLRLQMVGLSEGHDATAIRGNPDDDAFAVFYLKQGKLVAVDAVNMPPAFMAGKKLVGARAAVEPATLIDLDVDLKSIM